MGGAFGFGGDFSAGFGLDKTRSWVSGMIVNPGDQGMQRRCRGEERDEKRRRGGAHFALFSALFLRESFLLLRLLDDHGHVIILIRLIFMIG